MSESGEKYAQSSTVYKWKQFLKQFLKYVGGFWCERLQEFDLFFLLEEALLWIMDSYFSQKWLVKFKTP